MRPRLASKRSCSFLFRLFVVIVIVMVVFNSGIAVFGLLANLWPLGSTAQTTESCLNVNRGYICIPRITRHLGQYSPYFAVKSTIPDKVPDQCEITFANLLSRHGARYPTASKTVSYNATIQQIKAGATEYKRQAAFLKDYEYKLGADQLTSFGAQQLIDQGIQFYNRYQRLTRKHTPFIRASGEERVVDSAGNFSQGFHSTKKQDSGAKHRGNYPYPILVIEESETSNNTLNNDLCTAFEDGPASETSGDAQATWNAIWVPGVQQRLNKDLPGANLSLNQAVYLMDLCAFETVSSLHNEFLISQFCDLFTAKEFKQYGYYQSLGKFYGNGPGNVLGPTTGVGFVNELIARMQTRAVKDHTSVNHTLDDSYSTFPLGLPLYADFSHDNDMTGIFGALGLFNATAPLSNTTRQTTDETAGYSAAWTVPFAGRALFEKMRCLEKGNKEVEYVRVLLNDRVVPLQNCGADELGRCTLNKWVKSLSFARSGGLWDQCFE